MEIKFCGCGWDHLGGPLGNPRVVTIGTHLFNRKTTKIRGRAGEIEMPVIFEPFSSSLHFHLFTLLDVPCESDLQRLEIIQGPYEHLTKL